MKNFNNKGITPIAIILIIVGILAVTSGVYVVAQQVLKQKITLQPQQITPSLNLSTSTDGTDQVGDAITVLSPKTDENWTLSSSQIIQWSYSSDLRQRIANTNGYLVLTIKVASADNKHSRRINGYYFSLSDQDTYGAIEGEPFQSKDLLQLTSFSWKILEDLGYADCQPGGFCQGQGAEEQVREAQKLPAGEYKLSACIITPFRICGTQTFSLQANR